METWKTIEHYPNYSVSNYGRIKNNKTGRLLKLYYKKGYYLVYLYGEKRKTFLVHRLVAQAYIPNIYNEPQINHKDENGLNNNVDNLEWCSAKYNANYGKHKQKIKERMLLNNPFKGEHHSEEIKEKIRQAKIGKPSKRKIKVIIDNVEYESITDAMNKLKISTRKLYKIINKER